MSQELRITLSPEAIAITRKVQTLPATALQAIAATFDEQNQYTLASLTRDYLSFPKQGPSVPIGLRVQSGLLRRSMQAAPAVIQGQRVTTGIGSNLKYAAAHEFGATIPAHTIKAKPGKALRFMIGERVIFAKEVKIPAITLPARAMVQRAIKDRLPKYGQAVSAAILKELTK